MKEGHDVSKIEAAYEKARSSLNGKPKMIILKTTIAKGIPEVAGTNKGHGEAGVKFVDASRAALGLPEEKFFVSAETRAYFAEKKAERVKAYDEWKETFAAWEKANADLAAELASRTAKPDAAAILAAMPEFKTDAEIATRKAGSEVLQPLAKSLPLFITGSADLFGSTLNYIAASEDFSPENHLGRNIRFGIREHGMAAICNGIAYHGLFRASCATFLVFADYCRASIRLAALCNLPVTYIFTHDSVGVGEDGPTHQPVETVSGLRVIPNLDVIRPCDPEETAGAFAAAAERTDGPTLLSLTRQTVPHQTGASVATRREGALKGGYVLVKETAPLTHILMGSGSEVQHAVQAAKELGAGVRVVSLPCFSRFLRQSAEYQEEVLPKACTARVAIEAGVPDLWYRFVGLGGKVVGIPRFGMSAPGGTVMKELGMTAESVVSAAKSL